MELKVRFIDNWKRLTKGGITLLGVSGGMDSMVMATLFLEAGIKFAVAHCNFQLRGAEADLDEQLVSDWCATRGVAFHNVRFDTKKWCEEWKKGTQETARILRYDWLKGVCAANNYTSLATAHHANDNVETLLINLFKGTGMNGMHGIPEQNGIVVRPLLFATRETIAEYAISNSVPYREDASNATDAYLRNAVRLHILPVAKEWFPNAVQNVSSSIGRFAQAQELYNRAMEVERKKLLEKRGKDFYIPILKLQKTPPIETILYELLLPFDFSSAQLPDILQLLDSESGHFVASSTHRVIRNRDFLIITTLATKDADIIVVDGAPCTIQTTTNTFSFVITDNLHQLPLQSEVACVDVDKVTFPLILRRWKIGDYFYPFGMKMKKKKLSKFFVDQKVPLHEKEQVWVLESEKKIVWIAGMRLDERFKITDNTEKALVVRTSPV